MWLRILISFVGFPGADCISKAFELIHQVTMTIIRRIHQVARVTVQINIGFHHNKSPETQARFKCNI